jgi:hypothetical protein
LVGEQEGVVGDVAVQIGAEPLNRRAMRGQNHRHLGGGLAAAAFQKRLYLGVGGIAFVGHQALGSFDIIGHPPDEWPRDLADFGLIQSGFYRRLVSRLSGLRALPGCPVVVEYLIGGAFGLISLVLVEFLLLPERVGVFRQLCLGVDWPHEWPRPEQEFDKHALGFGVITANGWQRRCTHVLDRFCRIHQIQ